jgi:hypothetical protein
MRHEHPRRASSIDAQVAGVGVPGCDRSVTLRPLPRRRHVPLQQHGLVADVHAWCSVRRGGPRAISMPRMMGSALEPAEPLRRPVAERDSVRGVLSRPGRTDPSTARPPLMWSIVVIILATSAGLRNVLAPTIRPMLARWVSVATADMAV